MNVHDQIALFFGSKKITAFQQNELVVEYLAISIVS